MAKKRFGLEHTWCVELNLPQWKKNVFYDPFERIEANMNYTIIDHVSSSLSSSTVIDEEYLNKLSGRGEG